MRVIAGRLGRRVLRAAPKGVRPTADRVKESLFAAVGDLAGTRVLDLFAGTGALGIEALSRGAERVVFVERARASLRVLRGNLADLGLGAEAEVLPLDVLRALAVLEPRDARFDLVLVDPPYDAGLAVPVLEALRDRGLVAPSGAVVVEPAKRHALEPPQGWLRERARTYGDTVLDQLRPDAAFGPRHREEALPSGHPDRS